MEGVSGIKSLLDDELAEDYVDKTYALGSTAAYPNTSKRRLFILLVQKCRDSLEIFGNSFDEVGLPSFAYSLLSLAGFTVRINVAALKKCLVIANKSTEKSFAFHV